MVFTTSGVQRKSSWLKKHRARPSKAEFLSRTSANILSVHLSIPFCMQQATRSSKHTSIHASKHTAQRYHQAIQLFRTFQCYSIHLPAELSQLRPQIEWQQTTVCSHSCWHMLPWDPAYLCHFPPIYLYLSLYAYVICLFLPTRWPNLTFPSFPVVQLDLSIFHLSSVPMRFFLSFCLSFSRMRSKGSRFTLGLWGSILSGSNEKS